MHVKPEEFLEVVVAHIHDFLIEIGLLEVQSTLQFLVLLELLQVVGEFLGDKTIPLEDLDVVDDLVLHDHYSPKLVAFWISMLQILGSSRYDTW